MTAQANLNENTTQNNLGFSQTIARMIGTQTILVSPGLAKSWLRMNTKNRSVNESHVSRLAESMANGKWTLNGQGIVFSKTGVLLDGQHRLLAVLKYGESVMFDVRFGVEDSAMMTIDEGKKRTAADVLQIEQVKNATAVAAACKNVMKYDNGTQESSNRKSAPTNIEVFEWLNKHKEIVEVVQTASKYYVMAPGCPLPASKIASYMFICNRSDKSRSEEFFYKLATGVGLSIDGVVFKLRNRLNQAKNSSTIKFSPAYINGLVATAWNHFMQGNSPGTLKYVQKPGLTVKFK